MNFFNSFIDKGLIERLNNIVNSDFGCVTYTEAVDLLKKIGQRIPVPCGVGVSIFRQNREIPDRRDF